jgi:aminodeoxychorismate synthase component I
MTESVGWIASDQRHCLTSAKCSGRSESFVQRAEGALRDGSPFVILDDQVSDFAIWFEGWQAELTAWDLAQVNEVIREAQRAAAAGYEVAGFLSYRAGGAFDTLGNSMRRLFPERPMPLAWFGIFSSTQLGSVTLDEKACDWSFTMKSTITDVDYQARVKSVIDHIKAGSAYQVNLTFPNLVQISDLISYYSHVRQKSRASFGAIISTGQHQVLSFSPELFFRLSGKSIVTRPMKGTRARGACPTTDLGAASELANSPKEQAENLMIVDLLRNDLSRICEPGSIKVPELFHIEKYPTLWQMTSTVNGELQSGRDVLDVLRSLFPCGSIVGAPKIIASQIIASLEQFDRGLYTGSIGWLRREQAVFNVAIRTLQLTRNGTGYAGRLDVGAGIVADSQPSAEWNECMTKASFAWPN